jgi:hypothetical protein
MSIVIDKHVKAFGDSVSEAQAWGSVQDVVLAGPLVVQLVVGIVNQRRAKAALEAGEKDGMIQVCRDLLSALTDVRAMIVAMHQRGYQVQGAAEFSYAMLSIRELLAELQEPQKAQTSPSSSPTYDDLVAASKTQPPPQSWFDEKLDGLRGPEH